MPDPHFTARGSPWRKSRSTELRYVRQLRSIADQVGRLINAFGDPVDDPAAVHEIDLAMVKYADLITPWAAAVGARMVADVNRQDESAWNAASKTLSTGLRTLIKTTPTGELMRSRVADQVRLIKSLPLEAAQRVHELAAEAVTSGTRAAEVAKMIQASGSVTKSRATLIGRTEVARTASMFTEARSIRIGADSYIWRTAEDGDVRHDHQILNGKVFQWSKPPIADRRTGARANPGQIYRCRCYPEPLLPESRTRLFREG